MFSVTPDAACTATVQWIRQFNGPFEAVRPRGALDRSSLQRKLDMLSDKCNAGSLLNKYQPTTLTEVRGQPSAMIQLLSFVASVESEPSSTVFLFHGPTGVGKTASAWALARDLGCDPAQFEFGGVHEIPSGEQDGQAVADLMRLLRLRPMFGSGWKVAIVNEADKMTGGAEAKWLDALEHLPPKTVVIFTTNEAGRLSNRFLGRCEIVEFFGDSPQFATGLAGLIRHVWKKETGKALRSMPEDIGLFELASPHLSIRLALQQIGPYLRQDKPLPGRFACPIVRSDNSGTEAAKKAWATRRRKAVSHA